MSVRMQMILRFNVDVTVVFVGHGCLKGFRESLLHLKKGSAMLLKEKKTFSSYSLGGCLVFCLPAIMQTLESFHIRIRVHVSL